MDLLLDVVVVAAAWLLALAVHEAGHYVAGVLIGIPRRAMKIVLLPRRGSVSLAGYVALRDETGWVDPGDMPRFLSRFWQLVPFSWSDRGSRVRVFFWIAGGYLAQIALAVVALLVSRGLEQESRFQSWMGLVTISYGLVLYFSICGEAWGLRRPAGGGTDLRGVVQLSRPLGVGFGIAVALLGFAIFLAAWI